MEKNSSLYLAQFVEATLTTNCGDWTEFIEVIVSAKQPNTSDDAPEIPTEALEVDEKADKTKISEIDASEIGEKEKTGSGEKVVEDKSSAEEENTTDDVTARQKDDSSDEDDSSEEGNAEEEDVSKQKHDGDKRQDAGEEEDTRNVDFPADGWPAFDNGPKLYLMYETLFCQQLIFFKKALSCNYHIECEEGVVKLPDYNPRIFEIYIHRANDHRIHLPTRLPGKEGDRICWLLIRANILGDYLQDVGFKDAVIDALIHFCLK